MLSGSFAASGVGSAGNVMWCGVSCDGAAARVVLSCQLVRRVLTVCRLWSGVGSAWCRFGMVSAAPLTDGHSSAAVGLVIQSATHGQRSTSSLAKFPKVITADPPENFGRFGGSLIMTHIRARKKFSGSL